MDFEKKFKEKEGRRFTMNTDFLFDNIIIFPILAIIVIATYLIQFCSVISPCNVEFDEDNREEMHIMNRYNMLSDNAFTIYISALVAGIVVGLLMTSSVILIMLMIAQLLYMIPVVTAMVFMYERSKKYWKNYQCNCESCENSCREALTIEAVEIYN
ncbi:MAG: hypothetical protein IJF37_07625 [Lachnospiraceae bacterium]|nr:hypothetical protein [Lachnospiraceae bacterium]